MCVLLLVPRRVYFQYFITKANQNGSQKMDTEKWSQGIKWSFVQKKKKKKVLSDPLLFLVVLSLPFALVSRAEIKFGPEHPNRIQINFFD